MTARGRRATRGLAAATVSVILAAVSHTVGGGGAPAPWVVLGALALAWPIATILVGRRVRLLGQAAAVAAAQAALHVLFAVIGTIDPAGRSIGHVHGGHAHGDLDVYAGLQNTGAVPDPTALAAAIAPSAAMTAAHLVAAVASLALLHWGEDAVGLVVHWLAAHLRPVTIVLPAAVGPRPTMVTVAHATSVLRTPVTRRGPPVPCR